MRIDQLIALLFIFISVQSAAQQENTEERPLYSRGNEEKPRIRYNNISIEGITVGEDITVKFILKVDENGAVISGRALEQFTTIDDFELIQQLLQRCKEQLKYTKHNTVTEEYYSVVIKKE